jgi:hypothetical protein
VDLYDLQELARKTAPARRIVARVGLAAAVCLAAYGGIRWWSDSRRFERLLPTRCTLTKREVEWTLRLRSSRSGRKAHAWYQGVAHLELTHTIDGKRYEFTADVPADERLEIGRSYDCSYDPVAPGSATLAARFEPDLDFLAFAFALAVLSLLLRR